MDILVANKQLAPLITTKRKFIRISVQCMHDEDIDFPNDFNCYDILHLHFDDIEPSDVENRHAKPEDLFSEQQAKDILSFVDNFWDEVKVIVVNCCGGVSRSAAVAAAIGKIFQGDDKFIFENKRRCYAPNMYVYRTLMNTCEGDRSKINGSNEKTV